MSEAVPSCPECGGTRGVKGTVTITHDVGGAWGQCETSPQSAKTTHSWMTCKDCRARFPYNTLKKKGLI